MKEFGVSILDKNEMLHALPCRLVIGMSLILRFDLDLPSFSRLDFFEFFFWVLLIPSLVVSVEGFGVGMRIVPEFCKTSLIFQLLVQSPA